MLAYCYLLMLFIDTLRGNLDIIEEGNTMGGLFITISPAHDHDSAPIGAQGAARYWIDPTLSAALLELIRAGSLVGRVASRGTIPAILFHQVIIPVPRPHLHCP